MLKNTKKKIKILLLSLWFILTLMSLFLVFSLGKICVLETPTGALRYELFKCGCIERAIFLKSDDYKIRFTTNNRDIIYDFNTTPNYKVPKLDGEYIYEWIVIKDGSKYYANVLGI